MLFNLRPVLLESQGLAPALKSYVDRQRENKDLEVLLDIDAFESRLDSKAEGAIFSIVQEAVGNIRKHAEAKHVWITARQQNRMMSIIIQDDGCGFDVQQVEAAYATRGSMGLLNMRERAEIAHAKLTIESAPGKGTKVSLRAPLGAPTK
jgi:signal transduction histidine kinase